MGRKRNMPSRDKIFEYWNDKLDSAIDNNTCFKCGVTDKEHTIVERAHILSVFDGGSDSVDNIHLLCNYCHKQSEAWEGEIYYMWLNLESYKEFTDRLTLIAFDEPHRLSDNFIEFMTPTIEEMKTELGEDVIDAQLWYLRRKYKSHKYMLNI
jgi:hypothetical protein